MSDIKNLPLKLGTKFLRGDVSVTDGPLTAEYPKSLVSLGGVFGLRWPPLIPAKHFGKIVKVKVNFRVDSNPYQFEVSAGVVRELSLRSERLALKFIFGESEGDLRKRVAAVINRYGNVPAEHQRKYPRIPSQQFTEDFKLSATATTIPTAINPDPKRVSYQIGNLSPDGVLLMTAQDAAKNIRPGDVIDLSLTGSTRLNPNINLRLRGRIFRVTDEIDSRTQEERWSFGVGLTKIDETHKHAYFALLKEILEKIQGAPNL
ncbi:MAG: PilZ domain-containing protein [Bdellovibrionales bacterium]|nr:PilZ domain-containing protein [Bdellovibrionales bacterium]